MTDKDRDAELVKRVLDGDRSAFSELVDSYIKIITSLAFQKTHDRDEAEDIAQEAFVRAFNSLDTLQEPSKFGPWIYNITFRLSIDWIRKHKRRQSTVVSFDDLATKGCEPFEDDPAIAIRERQHAQRRVQDAMSDLPDHYRLVLTLRYVEKLAYKDIAAQLDEPEGTVANRIHRALKLLKSKLERGAMRS